MHLKKVEIRGFKSFADKTEVEFKENITAVVGPNGSGKSNISDAIRWVLGEQSVRSLRGNKMEDVIFAGTNKRRALGYAEVNIIFDNKKGLIPIEYEEVAISRRVFRSGESEYYLNKNACRLKDIRELLMDTGIGKDGYSIIGQGKIDEILSTRPEDRRNIFEEAAGIIKYKTRKEEAERKLERTETNIIRIKDLIYELSKQSETLEKESIKATNFKRLYNQLKELEVNIAINEINQLNQQIQNIFQEKKSVEEEIQLISEEKINIENKFNILKTNIEDREKSIEECRNRKMETIHSIERNKSQIEIILQKENFNKAESKRLEEEIVELNLKIEKLHNIELELINNQKELLLNFEEKSEIYKTKNKELIDLISEMEQKENEVEEQKNRTIGIYNNISDKKSELNGLNSFKSTIDKRLNQLRKEIEEKLIENDINHKKINELEIKEIQSTKKEKTLKEEFVNLQKKYDEMKNNHSILEKEINSKDLQLERNISSCRLLENMEEGYEGYYTSIKNIMKNSKRDPVLQKGFIGLVADLMVVGEKYERAIEISLGSNIQNLVTETEQDAKQIIEYLKRNNQGRVTLLPLNTIKGNSLNIKGIDKERYRIHGLASQLIGFDERFRNIFDYLLGRTIIIEDLDYGIRLAKDYNHSHRIVTLEGDVLNPGGSLTGGNYHNNSLSIISRKNKIKKLKEQILLDNSIKDNLLENLDSLNKKILSLEKQIQSIQVSIKENQFETIDIKNIKSRTLYEGEKLEEEIEKAKDEIKSLEFQNKDFDNKNKDIQDSLIGLDAEINLTKEYVNVLIQELNLKKKVKDDLSHEITELKIELNGIENHLKNLIERIDLNRSENKTTKELILDKGNTIETKERQEGLELEKSKELLIKELDGLKKSELEIEKDLNLLVAERDRSMKSFYVEQDRLREINILLEELNKKRNNYEVKFARISTLLENTQNKLFNDYELVYEEALRLKVDIKSFKAANIKVRELKEEIKALGNISLGAIEEYNELKERLEFITNQHKDLIKAKEDLIKIISELERDMKNEFTIIFKEINENFSEIFKILFHGGEAYLELEDNEDILNCGIEIKAQPPGKRLQSLSLLSGGEKSLTAVALLFSILKSKPAPFCILDEIDAALDEANINRYTNYLKSLSDETQFILITHRKTTMEIADVLYGVTMEEEGISKLVSVELKDNIDYIAS